VNDIGNLFSESGVKDREKLVDSRDMLEVELMNLAMN
jgi:hypothetical protein